VLVGGLGVVGEDATGVFSVGHAIVGHVVGTVG
jgi:hypothetical protein